MQRVHEVVPDINVPNDPQIKASAHPETIKSCSTNVSATDPISRHTKGMLQNYTEGTRKLENVQKNQSLHKVKSENKRFCDTDNDSFKNNLNVVLKQKGYKKYYAYKTLFVPTDENKVVKCRSSIRDESKSSVKPLLEETFPSCNMWIKNTRTNTNACNNTLLL